MVRPVAGNRPRGRRSRNVTAFIYALAVHLAVLALVVMSRVDVAKPPRSESTIIQAVSVDKRVIDKELNQRRAAEEQKRLAEQRRREAKEAAAKAKIEEQRRKEEEVRKVEQETLRKEELRLKAEADEQKRQEEERRKVEQEEQRKQEQLLRKEEQKRAEEQQRKEDALREQALADALVAEEQQRREAAADNAAINAAVTKISRRLSRFFNKAGLTPGLTCEARIRMVSGGQVVFVQIIGSSGDPLFDRQCETAIRKASPLPVPDDQKLFDEKFRKLNIRFNPWE